MKPNYKILSIILLLTALFIPTQIFAQASISIDHVDSLYNGKIQPDMPLKFHIRWTNNTGTNIPIQTTGYRLYLSNNGLISDGNFETPVVDTMPLGFTNMFDLHFGISIFPYDQGSAIVGLGGAQLFGGGLPMDFDGLVFNISTSVSSDFAGDSLCIDSTFFGVSGSWLWNSSDGNAIVPDWGGPYCYEILPSCCIGQRGNFNNSPGINPIDIADLERMISYMFLNGPAPTCDEEADFTGDGSLDVSDLVGLVAYMHLGGIPPADCQ